MSYVNQFKNWRKLHVLTKWLQVLFMFVALSIGSLIALVQMTPIHSFDTEQVALPLNDSVQHIDTAYHSFTGNEDLFIMNQHVYLSYQHLETIRGSLENITESALTLIKHNEIEMQNIESIRQRSQAERQKSFDVLDTLLSNMLGDPVGQTFGNNATIKVYSLTEAGYRGYMAKVRLHNPNAVRLVLSDDSVGNKGETTSQAAKRNNAALAINGGGYARGDDGLLYPIGITVVNGKIETFYRTDLSFVGFNKQGHLVGGDLTTREEIEALNVMHGATFVPTLLKDGKKMPIPPEWRNTRHPRTLIGHFSNGDVLFVVIDGRQQGYSNGVTLEEAQEKLLEFNVVDAYTLDGGGSSTFYYNGKVLNRPSDGRERLLPTNFIIVP